MAPAIERKRPDPKRHRSVIDQTNRISQMISHLQSIRNSFNFQKLRYLNYDNDYRDNNSLYTIGVLYDEIYTRELFREVDKYFLTLSNLQSDKKIIENLPGSVKWFFTGEDKKERFLRAFRYIENIVEKSHDFIQIYNNIVSIVSRPPQEKKLFFLSNQKLFLIEFSAYLNIRPFLFHTKKLQPFLVNNSFYFDPLRLNAFYKEFEQLLERKDFIERNFFTSFEETLRQDYENCKQVTISKQLMKTDISVLAPEISEKTLQKLKLSQINDIGTIKNLDLRYIDGIGDYNQNKIKSAVNDYIEKLSWDTKKIRINVDEKPSEDRRIVRDIYIYKEFIEDYRLFLQICDETKLDAAANLYRNLPKNITGFNWLFTEDYFKQHFIDTLQQLFECFNLSHFKINELYSKLFALRGIHLSEEELYQYNQRIWSDFAKNSSTYYAIIEEVLGVDYDADEIDDLLGKDIVADIKNTKVYVSSNLHLRPYQFFGTQYILNKGKVIVGDEMGLGKTIEAIAALTTMKHNGLNRFLIVCPASIIANWEGEIRRFSDLHAIRIKTDNAYVNWLENGEVGIVSYNMVNKYGFSSCSIDCLIVDEAHFIKNESMRRYGVSICIRNSQNVILITGTPLENRVREMIGLIELLNPKLASNLSEKEKNSIYFKKSIASIYLRRKREEVLSELPDLIENVELCEMTDEEDSLYNDVLREHSNPLAVFTKAKMALWEAHNSSKANRLSELIDMAISENRKVLVFSEFLNILDRAKRIASEKYIGTIKGDVPANLRNRLIQDFNDHDGSCVMCMQILAGGVGINLQSASVVIICEPQWKPSTEQQALSRAYRMGQTRTVLAYYLVSTNEIEKYLIKQSTGKASLFMEYADQGESTKGMNKQEYMKYLLDMERKNRGIVILNE